MTRRAVTQIGLLRKVWQHLLRSPSTQPKKSKRTHSVENVQYVRCVVGNVPYLRSVFVNTGQRRKRSIRNAKKVLICVRNGSMQCLYAFMSTYYFIFFYFLRSKSTNLTLGVRNVRLTCTECATCACQKIYI